MKKNKTLTFTVIMGALMLLTTAAAFIGPADESEAYPIDHTGYIPISTPQELAKIGKDPSYPLQANYYLANDIIFGPADDTNGGVDISFSASVSGTGLTMTLTPASGAVTLFHAQIGAVNTQSNNNTVSLSGIHPGTYALAIGGMLDSSIPFAYSVILNTPTAGNISGTFNSNGNFDPIGSSPTFFRGTFDGDGHTIYGMNTAAFSGSYLDGGLFKFATADVKIYNLGMADGSVTVVSTGDLAYAGGIVGSGQNLTIIDCYNTSTVTASSASATYPRVYAGGIIGQAGYDATITNCYNEGSIYASVIADSDSILAYAGGIVGEYRYVNNGISGCHNTGSVAASTYTSHATICAYAYVGGIAGYCNANNAITSVQVSDCYNAGPIAASSASYSNIQAAGIIGGSNKTIITDCYNAGTITASLPTGNHSSYMYAAGIVGYLMEGSVSDCYNTAAVDASADAAAYVYAAGIAGRGEGAIDMCYNTGPITAASSQDSYTGGIAGYGMNATVITNCYNTALIYTEKLSTLNVTSFSGGIAGAAHGSRIVGCYNTGSITTTLSTTGSVSPVAFAGGIVGGGESPTTMDCYNTGPITVSTSASTPNMFPQSYAGGIQGGVPYEVSSIITNCYNIGQVTAVSTANPPYYSTSSPAGIVGRGPFNGAFVWVTNCYTLDGTATNVIICLGLAASDGGPDVTPRPGPQGSGAKTASEMKPSLADAQNDLSIYYIGTTTVNFQSVPGWDFVNVWDVDPGVNSGYPTLRAPTDTGEPSTKTVTGTVTDGTNPLGDVTISFNGTSVTTNLGGQYVITAEEGETVTITGIAKAGYRTNQLLPIILTMDQDHQQNFVMTQILLEVSPQVNGNTAILDGSVDIASGASWVSIYVQFSDGTFQRSVARLGYSGSTALFFAELSGSAPPVMYMVLATDERPVFGTSYTTLAIEIGQF
ncbi:MAG: hypothetical protein LBB30_01845 [Candidatus Methanoplasma sp.]|jgi:hypothetical protein|nr:hypothetical protein [Candidatus Methanoplasma sp.]